MDVRAFKFHHVLLVPRSNVNRNAVPAVIHRDWKGNSYFDYENQQHCGTDSCELFNADGLPEWIAHTPPWKGIDDEKSCKAFCIVLLDIAEVIDYEGRV